MARFPASSEPDALSSRERHTLRCLVRGYTFAEVADSIGLPVSDIESVHASICKKLDLRGRPAVYKYAVAMGLLKRNGKT